MTIKHEERSAQRKKMIGLMSYSRTETGESYDAEMIDCTSQGMGLVTKFPYIRDTKLFIKSKNPDDKSIQKAEVMWTRRAKTFKKLNPRHRIGVKLFTDFVMVD